MVAFNAQGREVMDAVARVLPDPDKLEVQEWLDALMKRYRALDLICRLHFSEIPNPWRWPGLTGRPSADLVERKAVTVAFEYMLSVELLKAGGMIIPINSGTRQWLSEQLERLQLRVRSLNVLSPNHR
jgi:hypothetical protein